MGKKIVGICVICGKEGKLSREHFPPKGAFNYDSFKVQSINEHKTKGQAVWKEKWKHGGNARYATCEQCNNNTGAWYAESYNDFVRKIEPYGRPRNVGIGELDIVDFYPLRVVKQVLCSFLAAANPDEDRELTPMCAPSIRDIAPPAELFMDTSAAHKMLPEIRRLILDREATGLPEGFRLYMYLVANLA